MIENPTKPYSGLTIILDKPSRFDSDSDKLISGWAGKNFDDYLSPISRHSCQIRTLDEPLNNLLLNTKVILGLGEGCQGNLFSKDYGLNEIRGYPLNYQGLPLICSYAPQDAFDRKNFDNTDDESNDAIEAESSLKGHGKTRRRNWRWWLMQDTKRAIYYLYGKPGIKDYIKYIAPSNLEVVSFDLQNIKGTNLYIDIETNKDKHLTCIGVGVKNSIYVIPWRQYNNTFYYPEHSYRKFIQALAVAMNNNTVVVHNGMFDLFVLAYYYKIPFPKTKIIDTMIYWHRTYPELEKSLGHLLSYLTWLPYHKSEGIFNPMSAEQDRQLWNYNANDIIAMIELLPNLLKEIETKKTLDSAEFACKMIRPYLTMMYKGIKVDVDKLLKRFDELDFKRSQIDKCLNIITNKNINPRSPKQVKEYIYNECGHICLNEDAPTNEKTLLKLLTTSKQTIPSVRLILASRGVGKTASSLKYNLYCNKTTDEYNRITCAYNLCGTDTFRLSSKALLKFRTDKGFGTNLQNQDKNQRDLYVADDNKILIQVDQAGAEALIVAYLCRQGAYRDLFTYGIKIHSFVALHVFKKKWKKHYDPDSVDLYCRLSPKELAPHIGWQGLAKKIKDSDDWEAKERYYFIAKMICHASNYDMKAPTFQLNVLQKSDGAIALSIKECNEFLGLYHMLFPEIREWHCRVQRELNKTRILYNLFGEARHFFEQIGPELFKQGYAFIPQSTIGEITNRAAVKLQNQIEYSSSLRDTGFDLLQNGHDSILSQCINNESFIKTIVNEKRNAIEVELISPFDGVKFKMKSEVSIGKNWGPYKEKTNPDGMKEYKEI